MKSVHVQTILSRRHSGERKFYQKKRSPAVEWFTIHWCPLTKLLKVAPAYWHMGPSLLIVVLQWDIQSPNCRSYTLRTLMGIKNLNLSYISHYTLDCQLINFILDIVLGCLYRAKAKKVMFSQACAGGGGVRGRGRAWQGKACMVWGMCGKGVSVGHMRGRSDSHCSGRHASYWNAFLFCWIFVAPQCKHSVAFSVNQFGMTSLSLSFLL